MSRYLLVKVQPGAENVNSVRNRIGIMTGVSEVLLMNSKFKQEDIGTIVEEVLSIEPDKGILMDIANILETMSGTLIHNPDSVNVHRKADVIMKKIVKLKEKIRK